MAEQWAVMPPKELMISIEELKAQVGKILALLEREKECVPTESAWLDKKQVREIYGISSSTLERRVLEGIFEKSYFMGPKSPRYQLKAAYSDCEAARRAERKRN